MEKKSPFRCVSPAIGDGVCLAQVPRVTPSITECHLDLFQSSLKRRGSRETYKEKKAFNQVSRGFVLMLHLLKRQSPHFEFSQKVLALSLNYSEKHYLPKKNFGLIQNLRVVKIFFPNQQPLPSVSRTDKLLIPSIALCEASFGVVQGPGSYSQPVKSLWPSESFTQKSSTATVVVSHSWGTVLSVVVVFFKCTSWTISKLS